jgi:2-hydroxy-3-keto-5-methylthiopentenyl-1-phosphate phosphatase
MISTKWSRHTLTSLPVRSCCVPAPASPIIRAIFAALIGPEEAEKIQVVSNEVDVRPDGKFSIVYKHPDS